MSEPAQQAGMVTLDQLTKLLMLTQQRVLQLVKSGDIPQAARNTYPLVGAVQGYIKFLKDEERRTSKSAAASRVTDARAQEIELRIAERMHKLIDIDEHDAIVDEAFGMLKATLLGIPARVSRDMVVRRKVEDEINGALAQTASTLLEKAAQLRATGEAAPVEPEDEPGRVGSAQPNVRPKRGRPRGS